MAVSDLLDAVDKSLKEGMPPPAIISYLVKLACHLYRSGKGDRGLWLRVCAAAYDGGPVKDKLVLGEGPVERLVEEGTGKQSLDTGDGSASVQGATETPPAGAGASENVEQRSERESGQGAVEVGPSGEGVGEGGRQDSVKAGRREAGEGPSDGEGGAGGGRKGRRGRKGQGQ